MLPQPTTRSALSRGRLGLVVLTIILVGGLVVLITWFSIKPKKPFYVMENASVRKYNLTADNHLNATFRFTLQFHNPNHKTSIFYDSIEFYEVLISNGNPLFNTTEPFHQPPRNVTRINVSLVARKVGIPRSDAKAMTAVTKTGQIDMAVVLKARFRFKAGIWTSIHRTIKILCYPVTVSLSQQNISQNTSCEALF